MDAADTVRAVEIREFTDGDWHQVWPIVRDVIRGRDTYTYDPVMTSDQARAIWIEPPPGHTVSTPWRNPTDQPSRSTSDSDSPSSEPSPAPSSTPKKAGSACTSCTAGSEPGATGCERTRVTHDGGIREIGLDRALTSSDDVVHERRGDQHRTK
jgi:hypothetical protein